MARLDRSSAAGVAYGSAAPAIEVRGLSFAYPGAEAPVLEGLDWRVSQGAFALLVGGTGSGKSTLLSLLKPRSRRRYALRRAARAGRARRRHGCAGIGGARGLCVPGSREPDRVRNRVARDGVWPGKLGLARDEMRRRVAETSYFFGLEDWLHRDTDTLSGGRKQLLSLAAVLALRRACCCSTSPRLSLIRLRRRISCTRCFV